MLTIVHHKKGKVRDIAFDRVFEMWMESVRMSTSPVLKSSHGSPHSSLLFPSPNHFHFLPSYVFGDKGNKRRDALELIEENDKKPFDTRKTSYQVGFPFIHSIPFNRNFFKEKLRNKKTRERFFSKDGILMGI